MALGLGRYCYWLAVGRKLGTAGLLRLWRYGLLRGWSGDRLSAAKSNIKRSWLIPAVAAAAFVIAVVGGGLAWWQPWVTRVESANVADMALPLPDKPSIAVLPFVNLTGNPEDEFLPDGMSEDITTALGRLPRLFVISRTTTSTYKNKQLNAKQVAEELGVRFVLEGSVQRSGDTMRVTAQLIDAISGKHVWAENYDRDITDLFAVKDEIILNIASNVSGELDAGETDQIARSGTESLKAWTLTWWPRSRPGSRRSGATADRRD